MFQPCSLVENKEIVARICLYYCVVCYVASTNNILFNNTTKPMNSPWSICSCSWAGTGTGSCKFAYCWEKDRGCKLCWVGRLCRISKTCWVGIVSGKTFWAGRVCWCWDCKVCWAGWVYWCWDGKTCWAGIVNWCLGCRVCWAGWVCWCWGRKTCWVGKICSKTCWVNRDSDKACLGCKVHWVGRVCRDWSSKVCWATEVSWDGKRYWAGEHWG